VHIQSAPELLSTGQAAELLGSSRQHVVNLCERGVLPYVMAGSHRRVRRQDVQALVARPLTRDQSRALWLHQVVAAHVATDPDGVLRKARTNLAVLRRVHPDGNAARWLAEWDEMLDRGAGAVMDVLTSKSERAVELRQNSPFAGVLSEDERQAALKAFRADWRQGHLP